MDCLMAIAFVVASASANVSTNQPSIKYEVSSASTPCSNCDGNNVTCLDGVCPLRCVNLSSSGECLQCLDSRFYGRKCEHDCPDTCLNSRCQLDNSRVVCTEGCVAGRKGDNCGAPCPTACTQCGRYGDGCTGPCQNPRYYGPHCRTPCSSHCTGVCNRITGECGSCKPGYMGDKCNVSCPPNCTDGCDKDTGECIKLGNNVVIVVVIIAGTLGLVVLSVTIPLVRNQVQKRSKTRVVAPDIEQDISEHSYDYIDNTFLDMEDKVAEAVPVDDPYNTRSLRSSHPIGASAEVPQRANHKEFTAPVMEGGSERLSNETVVVFLPKPSVHVHYINITPSPKDSLLD